MAASGGLAEPAMFAGYTGEPDEPRSILLENHGLGIEILLDREHPIGATDAAGVADVVLESALTSIMDFEDSIAAVDSADKALAYHNWLGLTTGTLTEEVTKNGRTFTRTTRRPIDRSPPPTGRRSRFARARPDARPQRRAPDDHVGRSRSRQEPCPRRTARRDDHRALRDPRLELPHGRDLCRQAEDARPCRGCVHERDLHPGRSRCSGCRPNTVKIGIMDEERRTTVNLGECIRAAKSRVAFINTGFLDRTGDEIHTSMHAGPMVRKGEMKTQRWILAYEDWNVDVGIACGLRGRAQIGKGMWAAPDLMADMLAQKINHPLAGANCAWVPSPSAATLHATHYHRVDVARPPAAVGRPIGSGRARGRPRRSAAHPCRRVARLDRRRDPGGARQQRPGHPRLRGALGRPGHRLLARCPTSATSA